MAEEGSVLGVLGRGTNPLLGRRIGEYRLVERVGDGAYGEVYLAEHVEHGTPYALKVLHPSFAHHEVALKRFWREAETTQRLAHEHIVAVFDYDIDATVGPYLIMEYLEGETLGDALKREVSLPLSRVGEIVQPICRALGAAHDAGVIHRDLKPDNIFLARRNRDDGQGILEHVKVLDFGIARLTEGGESLTGIGQTLGTPEYMSPEQCRGLALTSRSDIYCLGVLLFQMLTGKLPFAGDDSHQVMVHHLISPVPRLDASFSSGLRDVLAMMLAKQPEERPQTMSAVWEGLAPWLPQDHEHVEISVHVYGDDDAPAEATSEHNAVPYDESSHLTSEEPALVYDEDAGMTSASEPGVILLVNKKDDPTPTMEMSLAPGVDEDDAGLSAASMPTERGTSPEVDHAANGIDDLDDLDSDTMLQRFVGRDPHAGMAPMSDLGTFEQGLLASLSEGDNNPQGNERPTHERHGWAGGTLGSLDDVILDVRRWLTLVITVPNRMTFVSMIRGSLQSGQFFLPTEEPLGEGEAFHFRFEDPAGQLCAEGTAEVLAVVWPGESAHPGISLAIRSCTFASG